MSITDEATIRSTAFKFGTIILIKIGQFQTMNEFIIKQQIEDSLIESLNAIIYRQTEDDVLYAINVPEIARNLSGPLLSLVLSLTANLITPSIQEFITSIYNIEEEESIEITHDDALNMVIGVANNAPENKYTNDQLTAMFEEEYDKVYNQKSLGADR